MQGLSNSWGKEIENSGSGHEIENSAGTKLTQRDVMQVTDGLEAVDDSTNQKTKIKMNLPIVSFEDWNAMTEQEKTAYKASHYRFGVELPDTQGVINAEVMKLLWENPNTTQAFASQTITLNSADYDFYYVSALIYSSATPEVVSGLVKKGLGCFLVFGSAGARLAHREITYVSDTSLNIGNCSTSLGTGTISTDNTRLIPTAIYGIKASFQFKVNAIASDLSTSAENCMMPDGVTPVSDAIESIHNWKTHLVNQSTGSATYVNLPSEFSELLIILKVGAQVYARYVISALELSTTELLNTCCGFYVNSSSNADSLMWITNTQMRGVVRINGSNQTTLASIYYR